MSIGLALDLSSPQGSFSFFENAEPDSRLIKEFVLPGTLTHSETLLTNLDQAMKNLGFDSTQLGVLVTSSGPGSFTGLRIAYSTLKALALVHQVPITTVSAPEALAWHYFTSHLTLSEDLDLVVLSYLTRSKWLASSFRTKKSDLSFIKETTGSGPFVSSGSTETLLLDPRIPASHYETHRGESVVSSLSSQHLCEYRKLRSAKTYSSNELAFMAPVYFGSEHFDY